MSKVIDIALIEDDDVTDVLNHLRTADPTARGRLVRRFGNGDGLNGLGAAIQGLSLAALEHLDPIGWEEYLPESPYVYDTLSRETPSRADARGSLTAILGACAVTEVVHDPLFVALAQLLTTPEWTLA